MNPITDNSDGLDAKLASDRVIDGLARDIAGHIPDNRAVPDVARLLRLHDAAPCETDASDDACGDTYLSEFAAKCQRASMTTEERIAAHNARVVNKVMELMQPRTQQTARPTPLSSFMHNIRGKATDALNQSRELATIGDHMPRKLLLQAFHAIRSVAAQALAESGTFKPDLTMSGDFDYYAFAKAVRPDSEQVCVDVEDFDATTSDEVWGIPTTIKGGEVKRWSAYLYEFVTVKGRKVAVYEVMED